MAGSYNSKNYYWLKVDTSKLDGKVTQVISGSNNTCYLTDKKSAYCTGSYKNVAPHTSYNANAGAYTNVVAGSYNGSSYYWIKVDTSKTDSSSTTAGTTITLTGNNLSKVTNVYIDTNNNSALDEGTDITVSNLKIISDTELTFTAPSMSPGTYNLIITNPGNVVVKGTLTYR